MVSSSQMKKPQSALQSLSLPLSTPQIAAVAKFLSHRSIQLLPPLLPHNPFHWIPLNHYPKTCAKEITTFLEAGKTAKQFLCFHYQASGGAVGGVVQGETLNVPAFPCKQQELQVIQCSLCTKCSLYTFSIVNDKNCPFFRFQNVES